MILLPAFWVRIYQLEAQSIWWDEGISLHLALSSWAEIARDRAVNIHPPLYFFLLKVWVSLVGITAFASRYFSVLASCIQVPLAYAVSRRWFGSEKVGWVTAVLVSLSPLSVVYAQEVRVYAFLPLIFFLLIATMQQLLQPEAESTWQSYILLGVLMWLGVHLHYVAGFMAAYCGMWGVIALTRQRRWPALLRLLLVGLVVVVASLPWFGTVLLNWTAVQVRVNKGDTLTEPVPLGFLLTQVWTFHLTGLAGAEAQRFVWLLASAVAVLGGGLLLWRIWPAANGHRGSQWLGHWLFPLTAGLYVWSVRSFSHPRYVSMFAFGLFPLLGYVAAGIFVAKPGQSASHLGGWMYRGVAALLGVVVLLLSGWGLGTYFFDEAAAKADMRGVADFLAETAVPNDLILLPDGGYALQFEYDGETPLVMPQLDQPDALWQNFGNWSAQPRRLFRVTDEADVTTTQGEIPFALESGGWLEQQLDYDGLRVSVYQLASPIALSETTPITVQFGALQLTGVWIEQGAANDTAVSIALAWQKAAEDENRYRAALRLIDIDGLPLAQWDQRLLDEIGRPTESWELGESIITYHRLPITLGTPPLTFEVDLSVYRLTEDGMIETVKPPDWPGHHAILGETTLTQSVGVHNPYRLSGTLPSLPQPVLFNDSLELQAVGIDRREITPGQSLLVALRWRARHGELADYQPRVALEQAGEILVESVVAPALGRYPTTLWQQGEIVVEHRFLPIPATVDGVAQLIVELEGEQLFFTDVTITAAARQFELPPLDVPANEQLGDMALLVGYGLVQNEIAADEPLLLTLVWQATSHTLSNNYTVFVHLLDESGRLIGQHDGQPVNGRRPTMGWVSGEYLVDLHEIPIHEPNFTGDATIVVGLYDPATGDRLLTANGADFIRLETAVQVITPDE